MKNIAVLGSGAIGGMLAAYLKRGGEHVTIIPAFRRESAARIREEGLTVNGPNGEFHVFPEAVFLDDLSPETMFDYVFLGLKANDFVSAVTRLAPHLKADGCLITLQNGINEEFLTPIVGADRVVAGISFAGGQQVDATHFHDHDGSYTIGELDGTITPRLREIGRILEHARPTTLTERIREAQWVKLGTVALHVPCCTVTGQGMLEVFSDPDAQRMFPILAEEVFAVAAADGYPDIEIQGRTRRQWQTEPFRPPVFPGADHREGEKAGGFPAHNADAYTRDIQRGAALEIDYTNGAVVRIGKRLGVPTPAHTAIIAAVRQIENGTAAPGAALMRQVLMTLGRETEGRD